MVLLRACILFGICLLLGSCGFSLRGNDVLTAKFSALNLQLAQPNSELALLLKRSLEIAAVDMTEAGTGSLAITAPVLSLAEEQMVSRAVSVNPRARAAQYELRMSVDAALSLGEDFLLGPETLLVERSYFEDIENIAGNQEELAIITSEMRRELVNQLLRRLEAVNI